MKLSENGSTISRATLMPMPRILEALEKAQGQLEKDIDAIEKDLSDNYVTKSYLKHDALFVCNYQICG